MPGLARGGRFDIADIVRAHRAQLESVQPLSRAQKRVLTDIGNCRTAALGGHLDRCTSCGYERPAYNSCRNRHCPKCQALAQEKWIAEQRARMLDTTHFHVVFTLPAELRSLAAFAPRTIFDALFRTASRTLLAFAERHLRATLGATLVLHTWTRDLRFHPHVHAIVTAGGLSLDATKWQRTSRGFLFPVLAMSRVHRGKMLDELKHIHRKGGFAAFDDFQDPEGFERLIRSIRKRSWNVYAKRSFSKGRQVLHYLGRYTHRVGIANSRILAVDSTRVSFRTKGDATQALPPVEFLRRFVQHVLPDGFHKIRHIGLYASNDRRTIARRLLGGRHIVAVRQCWRDRLRELTGRDVTICPRCSSPLISVPLPSCRDPPRAVA